MRTRPILVVLLLAAAGLAFAAPYADTPDDLVPYRGVKPYREFYTSPAGFPGPGREEPAPTGLKSIKLGVLLPMAGPDQALGVSGRAGIDLALEDANAAGGGPGGLPFEAVYVNESVAWGDVGNRIVDLAYEEKVWAVIGALEDVNTHVIARLLLKVHLPAVHPWGTDPTVPEHNIPWTVGVRPDDRQAAYLLARRIFEKDGHRRVAVFRTGERYGRMGHKELLDAARRLGYPVPMEVRFTADVGDVGPQIERLKNGKVDAVILWGRAAGAGEVLRRMRAAGLDVPVYGPDRLVDPAFLAAAGKAAEGITLTHPFNPAQLGEDWARFAARYREKTGREPDSWAAYGYDATRYLVEAVRKAGLNRARIRDALWELPGFEGVTGPFRFDKVRTNRGHMTLVTVEEGRFVFE